MTNSGASGESRGERCSVLIEWFHIFIIISGISLAGTSCRWEIRRLCLTSR